MVSAGKKRPCVLLSNTGALTIYAGSAFPEVIRYTGQLWTGSFQRHDPVGIPIQKMVSGAAPGFQGMEGGDKRPHHGHGFFLWHGHRILGIGLYKILVILCHAFLPAQGAQGVQYRDGKRGFDGFHLKDSPDNASDMGMLSKRSGLKIRPAELGQQTISRYLPKMLKFTKWVNTDLSKGFTISQVAQKHGWHESLVWSQALVNTNDFDRFKAIQWRIRT
jgi:hypothetical protein